MNKFEDMGMPMTGQYKFTETLPSGDKKVTVVDNLITTNGKKLIMQTLGRLRDGWGETMSFGTDPTAPSTSNEWMGSEVYRCPIAISKVDTSANTITVKANIPLEAQFRFKEVGIFPGTMFAEGQDRTGQQLYTFSSDEDWDLDGGPQNRFISKDDPTSAFTSNTYGQQIKCGNEGVIINYTTARCNTPINMGGYNSTSMLTLNFTCDSSLNAGYGSSMIFYLSDDLTKYASYSFPVTTANTYVMHKVALSGLTYAGGATIADFANITKFEFNFFNSPTHGVILDSLRVDRQDNTNISDVLFSRAAPITEKTKWSGLPLDVEYTITMGL